MSAPAADTRNAERRARDEQIASEPRLPPPQLPADTIPAPIETRLARSHRQPIAITGVVENGLARPVDPAVKLPEHSRVIIVAEAS